MNLNKKGFTLVELLAVIVILAVVMLLAVTAVGPLMSKSRKGALGTEGISLVEAAKTAYQAEQLNTKSKVKATSTVCFDLAWLHSKNFYDKGSEDSYTGSVLVTHSGGKYTYKFWISNGVYAFKDSSTDYDLDNTTVIVEETTASSNCNGGGTVKCLGTSACV